MSAGSERVRAVQAPAEAIVKTTCEPHPDGDTATVAGAPEAMTLAPLAAANEGRHAHLQDGGAEPGWNHGARLPSL